MAEFNNMKLTTKGLALQSKAQTGVQLNFTKVQFGDGSLASGEDILNLTALKSAKMTTSISSNKVIDDGTSQIRTVLSNAELTNGFYLREVGIFAQDPDEGEILYAYTNSGEYADFIPSGTGNTIVENTFDLIVIVGNASNITAVIPSGGYVSHQDWDEKNQEIDSQMAEEANNIKHPPLPLKPCKCDGVTDDSAQLLAILNLNPNIFIPPDVTCYLASSVELPNNTAIAGIPFHSVIKTNGNSAFTMEGTFIDVNTMATHKKNLKIYGIKFICDNPSNNHAVSCKTVDNIEVSKCVVDKMPLINIGTVYPVNAWDGTTNPNATAGITSEDALSHNVLFEKNLCVGDVSITATCISTNYCIGKKVKENYVNNYGHGIQWWGGDSNVDRNGAIANPRWDRNIEVNSNIVKNVRGGGIWGSMGKTVSVHHNYVENCGDVGIDTEGNEDFVAHHNKVKNCTNACLATFAYCIGIMKFHHNQIEQDGSVGASLYHNWNDKQTTVTNIELENNDFVFSGITGYGGISGDAMATKKILNNNFTNVLINFSNNNQGYVFIKNNNIKITNSTTDDISIIKSQSNHNTSGFGNIIKNNIIKCNTTIGPNSNGIYANEDDFNAITKTRIENNLIEGIANSIKVLDTGTNSGIKHFFIIKDNTVSGNIVNSSASGRGIWYLEDNKDFSNHNVPNAIPTSGTWYSGQHIKYDSPDTDGYTEAICTVSGTPGTWKRTGLVA